MYNDYYLISIDNKLDHLQTLISNQEVIINNQSTIIEDLAFKNNLFFWCIILMFAILLYHFYHTCFNKFR